MKWRSLYKIETQKGNCHCLSILSHLSILLPYFDSFFLIVTISDDVVAVTSMDPLKTVRGVLYIFNHEEAVVINSEYKRRIFFFNTLKRCSSLWYYYVLNIELTYFSFIIIIFFPNPFSFEFLNGLKFRKAIFGNIILIF